MRILPGLMVAAILAASISSACAEEWCGFQDKAGSRVRCGFSSMAECKQAVGDGKDAVCMPSPSFAAKRSTPAQS
jgi:hypothetical protein